MHKYVHKETHVIKCTSLNLLNIVKGRANLTKIEFLRNVNIFSINVEIEKGKLVAIVGHVGSGKSSLLSALLGETEKLQGNVKLNVNIEGVQLNFFNVIKLILRNTKSNPIT